MPPTEEVVFVTIRGDLEVNEVKLKNALHASRALRLAGDEEVRAAAGLVAGSAFAYRTGGQYQASRETTR